MNETETNPPTFQLNSSVVTKMWELMTVETDKCTYNLGVL